MIEYHKAWDHSGTLLRFVDDPQDGLRFEGFADYLIPIKHTGYYVDEAQSAALRGVVYRMPHGRFIPGYENTEDPHTVCLSFNDHTRNVFEAARIADRLADLMAKEEREYNHFYEAGRDAARALDEIADAWSGLRELARERRKLRAGGGDYPVIMQMLEDRMNALLEIIRDNKKLANELRAKYGDNHAFKEGSGL